MSEPKVRKYLKKWEELSDIKSWLTENDGQAFCKYCKCSLTNLLPLLRKHGSSSKHQENVKENPENSDLDAKTHDKNICIEKFILEEKGDGKTFCAACNQELTNKSSVLKKHYESHKHKFNTGQNFSPKNFDPEIASKEIRLAGLIVSKNLSFLFTDDFIPFMKDVISDSESIDKIKLDRKKVGAIIDNVIAPAQKEHLANILKNKKFAIQIDELTDITTDHCM